MQIECDLMGQAGQKLLFVFASLIETCDGVTHTCTVWTLTYNLEKNNWNADYVL